MKQQHKKDVGAVLHKQGVTFRVWAPFAVTVAVTGTFNNWASTPLNSEGDGYWSVIVDNAQAGQEYKFVINTQTGQLVHNDPRSLQLTTSAGNSVIVDPHFDWGDVSFTPPPFEQQVIYEMHIGTFNREDPATNGTFQSAAEKLDYLSAIGINMIELLPVHAMLMDRGWGYAPDYIYAVESLYGGRYEFLKFIKAAHERGIGVILDVVYNHFGPDDKMDLWRFDGWSENNKGGIYFYNDWRAETPWGSTRPDFGREEVRQYLLDNVRMWLHDFRLDGLRVDSTIYIRNVKGQHNDPEHDLGDGWTFLQALTTAAKKINPAAIMIAEDVAANDYITKPTSEGGAGFDAQWEVTLPGVFRNLLKAVHDDDRHLADLCSALEHNFSGNDFSRIIYSDSHDSAANGSSRLAEEIAPGKSTDLYARRRALQAASIVLTAPGMPMLFQGQESMQPGSFSDWQAIDWSYSERFSGITEAYKHLVALRKNASKNTVGLTGPCLNIIHLNEESKVLAYHRWKNGGPGDDVMVILNFTNKVVTDYSLGFPLNGAWKVRFNSDWKGYSQDFKDTSLDSIEAQGNNGTITIGPYSVLILSQDA